jgi:hypothetical protein
MEGFKMKTYEVLSLEWFGTKDGIPDWSNCYTIKAIDHENAAARWAEKQDQRGDYDIVSSGEHGPVLVREEGKTKLKTFNITAESVAFYYAEEQK